MNDARQTCPAASLDIDDGADAGASAGQPADERRGHVADALSDQFAVAGVMGLRDIVGQQGAEQRIDGTEQREFCRYDHDEPHLREVEFGHDERRQPGRDGANARRVHAEQERAPGHQHQGDDG